MRRLIIIITAVLLLTPVPVNAAGRGWYGSTRTEFQNAIKQKKLKLKKVKVGKTILLYDSKLPAKRVKLVRKWIHQLPAKVQKSARKVYFLRKKDFLMTGDEWLDDAYGYEIVETKEIYFYNHGDSEELRDTLYHEFGHAWDSRKKKFQLSSKKEWKTVVNKYLGGGDKQEWFAYVFAELLAFLKDPDFAYVSKTLGWR